MVDQRNPGPRPARTAWRAGYLAALVGVALVLPACNDDDDDNLNNNPDQTSLRVIHAAPDAPAVDVLLDDQAVVSDLDYAEGSGYTDVAAGTYDVTVEAETPGGNQPVISLPATSLAADSDYTVIATGRVSDATLQAIVLENDETPVSSGQSRVEIVHAAPGAPQVAVYATAPGADLTAAAPLGTLSFGESLDRAEIAPGDYEIRITTPGDPAAVLYDSGTVAIDAGDDLLIAAVASTGPGASPIALVVNDGSSQQQVLDAGATSRIRAGFLSPDAPAVDVGFNGNLATPAFDAATYPGVSTYSSVAPGSYDLGFVDDATQGTSYFTSSVTAEPGRSYTVLAVGPLSGIEPLVLTDDTRAIGTESRLRIVHAAPTAGDVDIYVTPAGTDLNTVSPAYAGVSFKDVADFAGYAAGNYDVTVVAAGTKSPAAATTTLTTANGDVNTLIVREATGGGAPYGILVQDETS